MKNNPLKIIFQNLLEITGLDKIAKNPAKYLLPKNLINSYRIAFATQNTSRNNRIYNFKNQKNINKLSRSISRLIFYNLDKKLHNGQSISRQISFGKLVSSKIDKVINHIINPDSSNYLNSNIPQLPLAVNHNNLEKGFIAINKQKYQHKKPGSFAYRNQLDKKIQHSSPDQPYQSVQMKIDGDKIGEIVIGKISRQNLSLPRGRGIFDHSVQGGI